MPNRRFDWHEHIKDVEGEYRARGSQSIAESPSWQRDRNLVDKDEANGYLRDADTNLEGTYLVRLFAAFEAATSLVRPSAPR